MLDAKTWAEVEANRATHENGRTSGRMTGKPGAFVVTEEMRRDQRAIADMFAQAHRAKDIGGICGEGKQPRGEAPGHQERARVCEAGVMREHTHSRHDQYVQVLSGLVRARKGSSLCTIHRGDWIWIPAGLPHRISWAAGTEVLVSFVHHHVTAAAGTCSLEPVT